MNPYKDIVPAFRRATSFLISIAAILALTVGFISGISAWISLLAYILGVQIFALEVTMMLFINVVVQGSIIYLLADRIPVRFSDLIRMDSYKEFIFKGTLLYVGMVVLIGIKVFIFP